MSFFTKEQLLKGIQRSRSQADKAFDKLQETKTRLIACRSVKEADRLMKLDDKQRSERAKANDTIDRLTRQMIDNGFTMTRDEFEQARNDKNLKVRGDIMFERFEAPKNRKMIFNKSQLIGVYILK